MSRLAVSCHLQIRKDAGRARKAVYGDTAGQELGIMIKVHIFHTGAVRVDQAIPHREKNPLAVTGFLRGEKKKLLLPKNRQWYYEEGVLCLKKSWCA